MHFVVKKPTVFYMKLLENRVTFAQSTFPYTIQSISWLSHVNQNILKIVLELTCNNFDILHDLDLEPTL